MSVSNYYHKSGRIHFHCSGPSISMVTNFSGPVGVNSCCFLWVLFVQPLSHMIGIVWPFCKRHFQYAASRNVVSSCRTFAFPLSGLQASYSVLGTLFVRTRMSRQIVAQLMRDYRTSIASQSNWFCDFRCLTVFPASMQCRPVACSARNCFRVVNSSVHGCCLCSFPVNTSPSDISSFNASFILVLVGAGRLVFVGIVFFVILITRIDSGYWHLGDLVL